MNDKCCVNCDTEQCPFDRSDEYIVYPAWWNNNKDFCSRYTPKPETGKIEPIYKIRRLAEYNDEAIDVLAHKINEIIAVVNRREK